MTGRRTHQQLLAQSEIVNAPAERACRDQSFEVPTGVYIAMATMFTGFAAVLGLAFRGGHMAVVVGVIFAFIAAFFAVPAMFPGVASDVTSTRAMSWFEFGNRGIMTATGHSSARQATTLILLLPFLILLFAVAIATIASLI
jgi:hypothetical protein